MGTEFLPARWWQAVHFTRINLKLLRGRDPWADRILARPWSFFSFMEYGYLVDTLLRSDSYFIYVAGKRAGLVSMTIPSDFAYIYGLMLLPDFQGRGLSRRIVKFVHDYAASKQCRALVGSMAGANRSINRLVRFFGGRSLGLGTTTLSLPAASFPTTRPANVQIRKLKRTEARQAWHRWRLYEVEHVAGPNAIDIAIQLLKWEPLPRGKYFGLCHRDQEIGVAVAGENSDGLAVDLFTSDSYWSSRPTAELVTLLAEHLRTPIRHLTLTQTHANALSASSFFSFERHPEQERHFALKQL